MNISLMNQVPNIKFGTGRPCGDPNIKFETGHLCGDPNIKFETGHLW